MPSASNHLPLLARFALFFEPISPRFVSFWLRRRLKKWKNRGLIDDYKVKTRRIGKFHYKIEVDFDLSPEQTDYILSDMLIRIVKTLRR
jgi:hypothetical protein